MSTYDKFPSTVVEDGKLVKGWKDIISELSGNSKSRKIAVECYTGVYYSNLLAKIRDIPHTLLVDTSELFKTETDIRQMTAPFLKDDVLFGFFSNLSLVDYFDEEKLRAVQQRIERLGNEERVIIFGSGSSIVIEPDLLVYADMPRWEIQQRMRRQEVNGLGVHNQNEQFSLQYKRGLFNDWRVLDKQKKMLFHKVDYWMDTVNVEPKMIDRVTFMRGMEKTSKKPFCVVPFFDPAPWGGQWMKEVCDLDRSVDNFGWCFNCVPEENSLLLTVNGVNFEMPSVNLIYLKSREVLGEPVEARFGKDFPIRFDFLDTMQGGNLSLQVHPTMDYAREHFGLHYTQEESYYVVDAGNDATVYLGVKPDIDPAAMIRDLKEANQNGDTSFDAEKYVNVLPARKHDHFLIPSGTIHCSGKNTLVLEISATPNLYTFKLWDWGRLGLDGKPRPINIDRGEKVIRWERDTSYVKKELVNRFEPIASGDGWSEERTGLHKTQFIETRRHTFTNAVTHCTENSVNVLSLVEGDEVVVESPVGAFEPFVVHYAETFIVPAAVGEYSVRPFGKSEGKICITIKAMIRY
jgi:mannose-6-phosphate isomerase class I